MLNVNVQYSIDREIDRSAGGINMGERDYDKSIPGPRIDDDDDDDDDDDACNVELSKKVNEVDSTQSPPIEQLMNCNYIQARPSLHLLSDRKAYREMCMPLQNAALKGDVEAAKSLLEMDAEILCAAITEGHETVLHVATGARQTAFAEEIIKLMKPEHLMLQDENGNTAFSFAAAVGAVQIAKIMLEKNPFLIVIRGGNNMPPLYMAALFGRREVASFLYHKSKSGLTAEDRKHIFFTAINTGLYVLALKLFEDDKELAVAQHRNCGTALHILARNPKAFASRSPGLFNRLINSFPGLKFREDDDMTMPNEALQLVKCLWNEIMQRNDVDVMELIRKPSHLLFDAARFGNFEFLAELIRSYPDLVHELDEDGRTVFHIAVLHRHTNIFNLIYDIGFNKVLLASYVDTYGNNILHLAAKYSPQTPVTTMSAAAFVMQRELRTFKEVEKLVQPPYREMKNSDNKTPGELFTIEHAELMRNGEQWMKSTAKSCMLVATLIAVVMFATTAAFSLLNDGRTAGAPIPFGKTSLFRVFVVADSMALSFSAISMLIFLSIFTSRFRENDFLKCLPLKQIIGLSALFVSVTSMMVTFGSIILLNSSVLYIK